LTVNGKNYLPDYRHMHAYAGVLNKILVSAPLFVMATIGVKARSELTDFEFITCSADQNRAIDSYVDIVRKTEATIPEATTAPPVPVRKLATEWIDDSRNGTLKPLVPVSFDDSTRDGVKSEIVRANLRVAECLSDFSEEERLDGHYWIAAQDAVLGARVAEVTKYADFASLSTAGLSERRSMTMLSKCFTHLTPAQRRWAASGLSVCKARNSTIADMAETARLVYIRHLVQNGAEVSHIAEMQRSIGEQQEYRADLKTLAQQIRQQLKVDGDVEETSLLADIRMGCVAALESNQKIANLQRAAATA